ncbi:MAG: hypothetical protein WD875_05075 [Pirellulales bacterium]
MIVWGSGGDVVHIGSIGEQECETCGQHRPFSIVLNYRYFGFYWVFNCVTERKYLAACDVCQHGWKLNPKEFQGELPPAPIPFMRRYGLLVLVGLVAVLIAAAQMKH